MKGNRLRATSIRLLAVALLLWLPAVALGETAPRAPTTIVVLGWFPHEAFKRDAEPAFTKLLGQHQLVRGRDYVFEFHQARSQAEVDRILSGRTDDFVVYSLTTSPSRFVIENGTAKRHVFVTYSDPLAEGWIKSYARPGGNSTGLVELFPVHQKRLELLRELTPTATRIAIAGAASTDFSPLLAECEGYAAPRAPLVFNALRVAPGDSPATVAARARQLGIQAAYVPMVGEIDSVVGVLYEGLKLARIPAIAERRADVQRGAVLALEVDRRAGRERTAYLLAQVIRGVPPAVLPVQSPRTFLLSVNLDAAKTLGLDVPRGLLRQADKVILDGR